MASARLLAVLVIGLVAGLALPAAEETLAEFDRRVTADLRARDEVAAAWFEQANAARQRGDHATAIALYGQVVSKHPAFTHATRRLCGELLATGKISEGKAACRDAAMIDPSPLNLATHAQALLWTTNGQPPSEGDRKTAAGICEKLIPQSHDDLSIQQTCTPVAFATNAVPAAVAGAANLERLAPNELSSALFAAVAHATLGEFLRADLDLWRARERGLAVEEYMRLRAVFHRAWPIWLTAGVWTSIGVAGWLAAAALLLLAGAFLSRATLAESERIAAAHDVAEGSRRGGTLRGVYSVVIAIAGAAYYLSLPLVFLVVLLVGGGVLYGMLLVGHIPLNLFVVLIVMILATCWSILKSLVVLAKDQEPGLKADLADHPRLDAVLKDVASVIGTRPVDSVYLLPGTEFAVMERGGVVRRLRGQGERCLLVGVGVLDGFTLRSFKAVLAHEYGHFVNKDTAGGRLSLAVRRSISRMAENLARSGAASWFNPAWLFLWAFGRLFERISQGASRLQEVMADRWAVRAYGSRPFIDGLKHVVERSVRFQAHVGATLAEVQENVATVTNLYTFTPAHPPSETDIREQIETTMQAVPSPYDSHPAPGQRFEWAARIGGPGDSRESGPESAWALLADRPAVETAVTAYAFGKT